MGKWTRVILSFAIVFALDITAVYFGWKAQETQSKVQYTNLWKVENKNPCQVAYALGLASISFFVIAHVLANIVDVYSLCTIIHTKVRKRIAIVCLVLTWCFLVSGLGFLTKGVLSINKSRATCGYSDQHYLNVGGWLCLLHAVSAFVTFVLICLCLAD